MKRKILLLSMLLFFLTGCFFDKENNGLFTKAIEEEKLFDCKEYIVGNWGVYCDMSWFYSWGTDSTGQTYDLETGIRTLDSIKKDKKEYVEFMESVKDTYPDFYYFFDKFIVEEEKQYKNIRNGNLLDVGLLDQYCQGVVQEYRNITK